MPWGMSESGYNVRDLEMTYQYSNFGVPGLGLRRGLGDDVVSRRTPPRSPRCTSRTRRCAISRRSTAAGADGQHGFYESVDYTPKRLPAGDDARGGAHVHGAPPGDDDRRDRERAATAAPCARAFTPSRWCAPANCCCRSGRRATSRSPGRAWTRGGAAATCASSCRRTRAISRRRTRATPRTQLLSNGRYAVMITAAGSGYSRCATWPSRAGARTRPATTPGRTSFFRDVASGQRWSAGFQPSGAAPDSYDVSFAEDRAEFVRRDGAITHAARSDRVVGGRRRSAPGVDHEHRRAHARDRSHLVRRGRARAARGGCGASRVLEPVHRDRELRERDTLLATRRPRSRHGRRDLARPRARGRRRDDRRARVGDRPRPVRRARAHASRSAAR